MLSKTVLFRRTYETLAQRLRDCLGCKDCCANTNLPTYFLGCRDGFNSFSLQRGLRNSTGSCVSYVFITITAIALGVSCHCQHCYNLTHAGAVSRVGPINVPTDVNACWNSRLPILSLISPVQQIYTNLASHYHAYFCIPVGRRSK